MTDQELLENAAVAFGIRSFAFVRGEIRDLERGAIGYGFNPLKNDEQCFQLMTRLNISLRWNSETSKWFASGNTPAGSLETAGLDSAALAVVSIAAALGKYMAETGRYRE